MRKFTLTLSILLLMVAVGTASAADTDNQTDSNSVITGTVTYCNSTEPFEGAVINVASMNGSNLASGVTGPDGDTLSVFSHLIGHLWYQRLLPGM